MTQGFFFGPMFCLLGGTEKNIIFSEQFPVAW